MSSAVGESITFAVGVAISPLPIVAVLLMLLSQRSGANSVSLAIGWIVGVAVVLAATVAVALAVGVTAHGQVDHGTSTVRLVLGAALVLMGLRRLRAERQHPNPSPPRWLTTVEQAGPGRAAELGVALAAVNPKNLVLIIGGGLAIAEASASTGARIGAGAIFVALASVTVVLPVVVYAVAKSKAVPILAAWRDWLESHAQATVAVVLVVLGALLVGKGLGGF